MASSSECLIWNGSHSHIFLLAKKSRHDCSPSDGMPIEELRRVIPAGSFISINCDKYNHNGKSCNAQIVIFFVAAERAANPADLAKWGLLCLHNTLKAKGQIYLTCVEGGTVMEVTDNAGIEKIKMTINQNAKMKGRFPFSGLVGLLLRMFFWQFLLGTFPAF